MINIDKVICDTRIERQIEAKELYSGLCSKATYFNYENGERIPDFLTYQGLMQRLGRTTRDFTYYLSEDEYRYLIWTNKARIAIKERNWEELENLLQISRNIVYKCNENIQRQYRIFLEGILAIEKNNDIIKAAELATQALMVTKPNFDWTIQNMGRLTEIEINLMLLCIVFNGERETQNEAKQIKLLKSLIEYVKHNLSDEKERIQTQAKLVYILLKNYGQWLDREERILTSRETVQLLCKKAVLYLLPDIMKVLLADLNGETEEAKKYKKQMEALQEILEQYGGLGEFSLYELQRDNEFNVLIGEYLYYNRVEQSLTQQEIADGICEPENYSRIEVGKRKPKKRNYKAFAEKLEIQCQYYSAELDTDDYRLLELKRDIERECTRGELEKEERLLSEFKLKMGRNSIKNRQFYETMKNCNEYRNNEINANMLAERDWKVLSYTFEPEKIGKRRHIYGQTEILLINHIANAYSANQQVREAASLLQKLLYDLQDKKFIERYENVPLYILSLLNLGQYYSDLGEYDKAVEMFEENLQLHISQRNGSGLSKTIVELAYVLELKNKENKTYLDKTYQQGFYLSDLFQVKDVYKIVKTYYEKNFNDNIQWY